MRRLRPGLLGLVLFTASMGAPASASYDEATSGPRVVAGVFSPDGNGTDDTLEIRSHLPRDADQVQLRISDLYAGPTDHVRLVQLGSAARGSHSWTWNGRNSNGEVVDVREFVVTARYLAVAD